MQQPFAQPDAAQIPDPLIDSVLRVLRPLTGGAEVRGIKHHDGYSNDLAEIALASGRTLMVKRGRQPWSRPRFQASRLATRVLARTTDLAVPTPLPIPEGLDERPVEVYWKIALPTLDEVWPRLSASQQAAALRSWGELVRDIHRTTLPGHGPIPRCMEGAAPLSQTLAEDLGGRLYPALWAEWPTVVPLVDLLLGAIPEVTERAGETAALLHGDLHMGNVLCAVEGEGARCVGLLDWESAQGGPPEFDLARLAVSNTTLFNRPVRGEWLASVLEGYGETPDPLLLSFSRIHHYLNLGFHSVLVGHDCHAGEVARAAEAEGSRLRQELSRSRSAPSPPLPTPP